MDNNKTIIFADFNNADSQGLLRLNCDGTLRDFMRHQIVLSEGQEFIFSDGDLQVSGHIVLSDEGAFAARISWQDIIETRQVDGTG